MGKNLRQVVAAIILRESNPLLRDFTPACATTLSPHCISRVEAMYSQHHSQVFDLRT